jgi:hypothetical protein
MITVRFPSGAVVKYPEANYVHERERGIDLFTQNENNPKSRWIATVLYSSGAIIDAGVDQDADAEKVLKK